MPTFKRQRRARKDAEEDTRPAEPTAEETPAAAEGEPTGDEPRETAPADETTTEEPTAPDQAISGAGPDATASPSDRDGYTAPWGTGGFTLVEHTRCMDATQYSRYPNEGPDALPEECRTGHPRR